MVNITIDPWEAFLRWIESEDYQFRLDPLNFALDDLLVEMENIVKISGVNPLTIEEKLEVILNLYPTKKYKMLLR